MQHIELIKGFVTLGGCFSVPGRTVKIAGLWFAKAQGGIGGGSLSRFPGWHYDIFLIKKNIMCWARLKLTKLLATAKQLIRKNSVCCLKNQKNQAFFFSQSKRTDNFDLPSPCLFSFTFHWFTHRQNVFLKIVLKATVLKTL